MATHPADSHDTIRVRGARENNLTSVDVDVPKRRLTVFTGRLGVREELIGRSEPSPLSRSG